MLTGILGSENQDRSPPNATPPAAIYISSPDVSEVDNQLLLSVPESYGLGMLVGRRYGLSLTETQAQSVALIGDTCRTVWNIGLWRNSLVTPFQRASGNVWRGVASPPRQQESRNYWGWSAYDVGRDPAAMVIGCSPGL
ncbi:hypothetical protein ACFXG4_43400 [Nocardia sp. NPDC059246]|uniref:hypothetical protein n=1 Tax=unclassified Nocardia TaxID=2637762 RepID=UPI003674F2D3